MKPFAQKFVLLSILSMIFVLNTTPFPAQAADSNSYELLAPLPLNGGVETTKIADLNTYIPNMVKLIIGIAGALAVLRIIFGGIQYMTTEAFEGKSDAKNTIWNAIIGLLLALSAYIILYTVNPKLVEFDFSVKGLELGAPIGSDLGTTTPGFDILGGNVTADCPVDSSGTKQKCTCVDCVNAKDVSGIKFKEPDSTTLNARLLKGIRNADSPPLGIGWQITEAWPPTVVHTSACHSNGTCVDMNLTNNKYTGGKPQIFQVSDIKRLSAALIGAGLGVIYEVNTENYEALKNAGVDTSILRDVSKNSGYENNTAPSFHVYLK